MTYAKVKKCPYIWPIYSLLFIIWADGFKLCPKINFIIN
jgi:hypothetical protein